MIDAVVALKTTDKRKRKQREELCYFDGGQWRGTWTKMQKNEKNGWVTLASEQPKNMIEDIYRVWHPPYFANKYLYFFK